MKSSPFHDRCQGYRTGHQNYKTYISHVEDSIFGF